LLATDHYPPFIGGGQRQSRLLAQCLSASGHTVEVVAPWQDGLPALEEDGSVRVHRIRQVRTALAGNGRRAEQRHQPPFPDPASVVALRRIIRGFRPAIVHSHGWIGLSCAVALSASRIPLLVSARDYGYTCAKRTLLFRGQPCSGPGVRKCLACSAEHYGAPRGWVAAAGVLAGRGLLRRRADGLHSVSAYVQRALHRDFVRPSSDSRVRVDVVIPDFWVDDEEPPSEEARRKVAQLPEAPFILFVGAFRREKGIEQLFGAYARLESPPPLVLLGTLERDFSPAPPPGATMLTDVPHSAVLRAWDRCLFGVAPSLLPEPFGTVVAEGMSRGKAIIGTKPGGHEDMIVDGETGLLVGQGDVVALAEAMRSLVEDAGRRDRLGRAAREHAELASARIVVPRFERVYAELIRAGEIPGIGGRAA
jgi:glycosyltransferase involved in cell wall biosynthesis